MIQRILFFVFWVSIMGSPLQLLGQTEPEDIVMENDAFQDHFYEAIKQKGIENYDKALESLQKALELQPNNPALFFEIAKNYYFQKKYKEAYDNFEKVTQLEPKNRWAWVGMYDVCYDTKDYNQAVVIVQKLIEFKEDYKNDLLSLYMNTQQYDKALTLLNELNEKFGNTDQRDMYKRQILQDARFQGAEKNNLEDQIRKNPKEESNYIELISIYSKSNQEEKAMEVAKKLEKEIPESDWAQVSLFKFHLNNNDGPKAVNSMNKVFASDKIDKKIKHRILNEFLIFTQHNPQFSPDLEKAINYFSDDKEVQVAKEIGKFFLTKKDTNNALVYFEKHLSSNPDDIEAAVLYLQTLTDKVQFDKVVVSAGAWLERFPTQPQFYYYQGLGYNQLKNFKKAKEVLESGMDFLVDDLPLEINFNIQLGESYHGLGDEKKKEQYFTRANALLKQKR